MSITNSVPLKSYSSMKCFFRKIRIFFDIENWLWKSEFCHFWQFLLLGGWLLVLGIKEGLVECAAVCVKSVVILVLLLVHLGSHLNYQPSDMIEILRNQNKILITLSKKTYSRYLSKKLMPCPSIGPKHFGPD